MKVLLVGLGSIGKRHLANLQQLVPTVQIAIWHQSRQPSYVTPPAETAHHVYNLQDALAFQADIALITCPASLHIPVARALAQANIHLFIEKPFSHTLDGVDNLIAECWDRTLVLMVGYNFRFYRPLQIFRQAALVGRIGKVLAVRAQAGQYLPDWRPGTDYRQGVSAQAQLGGGAVLELSHELDYVRWIVGEINTVSAQMGHVSDLEIDVEDVAEITLGFQNGVIGNVHVDMLQRAPARTCELIGSAGTLTWDGMTHLVRWFDAATTTWTDLHPAQALDRNDMYVAELQHFLDCVRNSTVPIITGDDGKRVLQIALAAKQSSREGRVITL